MWLNKNVPKGTLITGAADINFASVGEEMQQPMYFLECQCFDTFKLFSREREMFPEDETPERVNEALDKQERQDLVLITPRQLSPDDFKRFAQVHLKVRYMREFAGSDMNNENFYIFHIAEQRK